MKITDDSIRNYQLSEIVIKPKKEKYSKKNNPAIELIEKVIANKNKNRIENNNSWQFRQYEKLTLSLNNIDNAFETKVFYKSFKFLPEYLWTSELDSSSVLTLSIKEVLSDEYRQNNPERRKTIIQAAKRKGIDHLMEIESLDAIYSEAFKEINLFDNDLEILMKHFVSPLSSSLATSFYKYYILDTIIYKNEKCIIMDFAPHNSQDFGFTGRLWILPDQSWAVKKVMLNIPWKNSVNFVKQMRIFQEFGLLPSGVWAKSGESIITDFELSKYALGVYAKKTVNYEDYIINSVPGSFFTGDNVITKEDAFNQPDSVWLAFRMTPLQKNEQDVGELLDRMMSVSAFSNLMKAVRALTTGYIKTNASKEKSIFDAGPIFTFISGNPLEGIRLRLGGMTTANLNKHLFLNGYIAYGTRDKVFKYTSTATFAFNKKKYHENEYRKNNLAFTYSYDVNTPGTMYSYIDKDNVWLSIRRGNNNNVAYRRRALFSYEYESPWGLSFKVWTNNQNEKATGEMQFQTKNKNGDIIDVKDYTSSAAGIRLRLARNEKIFQNKDSRFSFYKDAPVFGLSYTAGIKGYLKGEYAYHALEASVEKRLWFSAYGDVDITGKVGKIWGELPFPLLMIPNANQTYFIQAESYSLMNILEFINDKYVSLDMQFHFNGLLFNRIPFLHRLKLREVAGISGIYGNLSDKNDPSQNPSLFIFPAGAGKMKDMPYMEASAGVENIFKVFQIRYVRRLSYLDNPGISKNGIRFAFTFTF
jgi:hypothetical protein